MKVTVYPSAILGKITAPASKSQTIRAIVAAMMSQGKSTLINPSLCEDALSALRATESCGITGYLENRKLMIEGGTGAFPDIINCGESGLLARLMIPLVSLGHKPVIITGEGTLLKRKLGNITIPLQDLGVLCHTSNGCLPVTVKGPLSGKFAEADGSESSQFISGLLMACPLSVNDKHLRVVDLSSQPYIDLTLEMLRKFGIIIENSHYRDFYIEAGQVYQPAEISLEGDWSGAAFLAVAGLAAGNLRISGLNLQSEQADLKILEALAEAGACVEWRDNDCIVTGQKIRAFCFDATHCPDLFPPLAVLAALAEGTSTVTGVRRLAQKESNRGLTLQKELGKLGIEIYLNDDQMMIKGGQIQGGEVFSHHDHRIAMAAAVAGLIAKRPVTINHADCVSKSWPSFFDDLVLLGARIDIGL